MWNSGDFDYWRPIRKGRQWTLQSGASGCKTSQMVAGARFELYSAYPIRVPAVPASVFATR